MVARILLISIFSIFFVLPATLSQEALADHKKEKDMKENTVLHESRKDKYTPKLIDRDNWEDRILDKIPYGKYAKQAWKIADGDVDIYLTGLRVNRHNKGLKYKTSTIPFIGTADGLEFQFDAGDKMGVSFKSNIIPFAGQVDGFSLKGSASNKGSKIFARYAITFN